MLFLQDSAGDSTDSTIPGQRVYTGEGPSLSPGIKLGQSMIA